MRIKITKTVRYQSNMKTKNARVVEIWLLKNKTPAEFRFLVLPRILLIFYIGGSQNVHQIKKERLH